MLSLQSHFESKSSCCYHMYLYIACVPSKLSFGPHIRVKATRPCIHCVAIACTHVSNSWASQALFLVSESKSHSSRDNHPSLCPPPCHCVHGLHRIQAPWPWLHALARVITTPCSCLRPMPLHVAVMAPCHVPSYSWCSHKSWQLPMNPFPCMRHCDLMCRIPHRVLSWLYCCCISMLSNRPWLFKSPCIRHCALVA